MSLRGLFVVFGIAAAAGIGFGLGQGMALLRPTPVPVPPPSIAAPAVEPAWEAPPVAVPPGAARAAPGLHRHADGLLVAVAAIPGTGPEARTRAAAACRQALAEAGATGIAWPIGAGDTGGSATVAMIAGEPLDRALAAGDRRLRAAALIAEIRWGLVPDGEVRELTLAGERIRLVTVSGPGAAGRVRAALATDQIITWNRNGIETATAIEVARIDPRP